MVGGVSGTPNSSDQGDDDWNVLYECPVGGDVPEYWWTESAVTNKIDEELCKGFCTRMGTTSSAYGVCQLAAFRSSDNTCIAFVGGTSKPLQSGCAQAPSGTGFVYYVPRRVVSSLGVEDRLERPSTDDSKGVMVVMFAMVGLVSMVGVVALLSVLRKGMRFSPRRQSRVRRTPTNLSSHVWEVQRTGGRLAEPRGDA